MSLPVRHLPVLQNWDCHVCGTCCKEYLVTLSDEERRRIESEWRVHPAPIDLAAQKLVQVDPEVVLEDEHASGPRLRGCRKSADDSKGQGEDDALSHGT